MRILMHIIGWILVLPLWLLHCILLPIVAILEFPVACFISLRFPEVSGDIHWHFTRQILRSVKLYFD